jgi:hypothetical protein
MQPRNDSSEEKLNMKKSKQKTDESDFIGLISNAWMNELLVCENTRGKSFIARLVAVRGNSLLFESKDGVLIWDSIDDIKSASLLRSRNPEVVGDSGVI